MESFNIELAPIRGMGKYWKVTMTHSREKLLIFGGKPQQYLTEWDITSNLTFAENKLAVDFEEIPADELISRYESLSADDGYRASQMAQELLEGVSGLKRSLPKPPSTDGIVKAAKLYLAMKAIQEEREGDALTIVCKPWIEEKGLPTPCLPLMLFQEEEIPAACQGDIDALLTMVLFKRVSGLTSFMGGAIASMGELGISHCVLSRKMLGPDAEPQPYRVCDFHGKKDSPTVYTEVPAGQTVTIARLTQGLESLLLITGTLVACKNSNSRCRNTMVIHVPDRSKVFRAVKGHQNHYVVACGDHAPGLTQIAEERGIAVVNM